MTGRPLAPLELGAEEEKALRSLASRRTTAQALALRARIVLACAAGAASQAVAARLGVTPADGRQMAGPLPRAAP
jgi:hypothetical protein